MVVIYQGKIKSGGSVRYDIADVINNNYNSMASISQIKESGLT